MSVSVLSVGATERNSRAKEKRASKNGEGGRKEACMKRKKFGRHFEMHEKASGHFSAVSHRGSFVATATYTLMLTKKMDQKERPSAVYSTVVSLSHGRGQREQSLCWAFSVYQHASHSPGCQ